MPFILEGSVRHRRTDYRCCKHRRPQNWAQRLRARLARGRRCALCAFAMDGGLVEGPNGVERACACWIRSRR